LLEQQKSSLIEQRTILKQEKSELKQSKSELDQKLKISDEFIKESLSFKQGFWVMIYSVIVKLILTDKQKKKLYETPRRFFSDSSSKLTRSYALFFNIINKD